MPRKLDTIIDKIKIIENYLAEEIAPEVNELLKESVWFSLIGWYNDYYPKDYIRTYNFMKILDNTRTRGKGNRLTITVDSGVMNSYPGFWGQKLQPSTAFDYMFMNGEHGHGRWMMHRSRPLYIDIEKDIKSGFGGQLDIIVNKKIEEILRK